MSYQQHFSTGSGSRPARRNFEFGRTYVVRPKGKHQATIVWLHGLGDNGSSWSQQLENLPLPNIKWICPTAPTRPVAMLGGFTCTAWFDVGEISEDSPDDWEGLDASAAHVANLLSTEPADASLSILSDSNFGNFILATPYVTVKVAVGGFSMGAATALYSATCAALGQYGNGNAYPINLRAVVGLSGWLPGDDVVPYSYGEKSAHCLNTAGFRNLTFKSYEGLGHYTVPGEMDEARNWLTSRLGLEGSLY
ncbi:hypothetical protein DKX38_001342 [Salix brachista]|uniref:Phospholipase/carboxylesterase/thioesterase domain-containing protein n=1 Tax=Salix brachista TaxID=2182728 RepID=A0A5N5P4I4_9ROSI|nr:hypothetical protein DKX38_001342 [Salix brachista]